MIASQDSVETVAANIDAIDAVGDARPHCALPLVRLHADAVRRFFMTSASFLLLPLTARDSLAARREPCDARSDIVELHARRHRLMLDREIAIMLDALVDEQRAETPEEIVMACSPMNAAGSSLGPLREETAVTPHRPEIDDGLDQEQEFGVVRL